MLRTIAECYGEWETKLDLSIGSLSSEFRETSVEEGKEELLELDGLRIRDNIADNYYGLIEPHKDKRSYHEACMGSC